MKVCYNKAQLSSFIAKTYLIKYVLLRFIRLAYSLSASQSFSAEGR
jgi:hypothetical protein